MSFVISIMILELTITFVILCMYFLYFPKWS